MMVVFTGNTSDLRKSITIDGIFFERSDFELKVAPTVNYSVYGIIKFNVRCEYFFIS